MGTRSSDRASPSYASEWDHIGDPMYPVPKETVFTGIDGGPVRYAICLQGLRAVVLEVCKPEAGKKAPDNKNSQDQAGCEIGNLFIFDRVPDFET